METESVPLAEAEACGCSTTDLSSPKSATSEDLEVANLLLRLRNTENESVGSKTRNTGVQVCTSDISFRFTILLNNMNISSITGLPSMSLLDTLTKCYESYETLTARHILTPKERIVLTMMKLKHNTTVSFLSSIFGCSVSTCSTVITATVRILADILSSVVHLPGKDEVLQNMPLQFKDYQRVRIVLDCTEIPVSQPKCLTCALSTYSHYKKQFTCKYMIGVTPGGLICHVGKGYGGKASDKQIF